MLLYHLGSPSRILGLAIVLGLCYYLAFASRLSSAWPKFPGSHKSQGGYHPDIRNTTLGFQRIFVINMPSRTDRRDAMSLAAAVSDLQIDFINGVRGDTVLEEALPPEGSEESVKLAKGIKGSWRSHMNALQEIVHQNLSTALIFEDDVDWDIRLRSQLETFATASALLTQQPPSSFAGQVVAITANPEDAETSIHNDTSVNAISSTLASLSLTSVPLPTELNTSPYGDPETWDLLWLGHCGAGFPRPTHSEYASPSSENIILTNSDDVTVPLPKYLTAHPFGPIDALASSHPPHTRVYHRASGGALCTVAYAVSQRGARRLLHEFGVKGWRRIWDVEMGGWCAASDASAFTPSDSSLDDEDIENETKVRKSEERVCITVQPPIFAHHHPKAGRSDIGGVGGGYARNVETKYVRFSVRMNLKGLMRGEGEEELVDQWPD